MASTLNIAWTFSLQILAKALKSTRASLSGFEYPIKMEIYIGVSVSSLESLSTDRNYTRVIDMPSSLSALLALQIISSIADMFMSIILESNSSKRVRYKSAAKFV